MVNVYKTKLDIKAVKHVFKPVFVQYDHARLEIELLDGGLPYKLTNVSRVEFTHVRKDGAVIIYPGEIVTIGGKSLVCYDYQGTEMDELGVVQASFALFNAENRKVSPHKFEVVIRQDLRDETFNPAEPNYGLLQTLIADVEYVKENGGPKGERGLDGYTPIKGVDYFDGVNGRDGVQGPKGDPFRYADFTTTQLEALRGQKGDIGPQGEPGLGDIRLDGFMSSIPIVTSSANRLINGVTGVTVVDANTLQYITNTTYGHVGFTIPNNQTKKYLSVVRVQNKGTSQASGCSLMVAYSNQLSGSIVQNGQTQLFKGPLVAGEVFERVIQFSTDHPTSTTDAAFAYATLGFFTSSNGANIQLTQKVYDITGLTDVEIAKVNWLTLDKDVILHANYAEVAESAKRINYRGSKWQGKTWLSLGDSITAPGTYQNLVLGELGFGTIVNKGVSGTDVRNMTSTVTNEEILTADLITLYGAFNDMYTNAPTLGTIQDIANREGTTFIARLKYTIETILTIKPTAKLVIIGTHNGSDQYRPALYAPIRDGKNIGDYVNGMGEVARYYGLPFIDMYAKSGFNAFNLSTYTTDGLHPNLVGYRRIAEILTGELQKIEPI